MNTKLLLICILIAGISCTTVYKSGQTPDDVYYSPAIPQNNYVSVNNEEEETYSNNSSEEDREIRRRINNRRLRVYDDYDYNYPYAYNYSYNQYSYNPYYSNYSYACSCYPPVYGSTVVGKSTSTYSAPRKFNLGAYGNTANNDAYMSNPKSIYQTPGSVPVRTFSTSTTKSPGVGNFIRRVLTNSSGSNANTNDNATQTRTYQPVKSTPVTTNTNTQSPASKSNSGNVPVRTFRK